MSTFNPTNTVEIRIPSEDAARPFLTGFTISLIAKGKICLVIILNFEFIYVSGCLNIYDAFLQVVRPEIDLDRD